MLLFFFFFNDTAPTEIYPLPLHDALPISRPAAREPAANDEMAHALGVPRRVRDGKRGALRQRSEEHTSELQSLAYLVCRLLLEKINQLARARLLPPRRHQGGPRSIASTVT